jgi:hypothetical protein
MLRNNSIRNVGSRRISSHSKRCFGSSELSTKLTPKEARELEYGLLDSTCYENERMEYLKGIVAIRNLRVVEFMGKYKPVEEKISRLEELKRQFQELK